MKIRRTCRDVTRLVFEGQDRALSTAEWLSLRLHWMACGACRHFKQQASTMRLAMDRWRRYRDEA